MRLTAAVSDISTDRRGFVHKKVGRAIVGGVTGFIGGGPGGAIGGAVGGFVGGGAPAATVCPPGFDPTAGGGCAPRSAVVKVPGIRGIAQRFLPGGATGFEIRSPFATQPIQVGRQLDVIEPRLFGPPPMITPSNGRAVMPAGPAAGVGQAVVGRFGAGIEPFVRTTQIRDCPRGAVLAVDGLCYNRRDLRNSERFWPRGRRPLLTGGEMRAISTAATAARKLQRKQKDLMDLGLLPKAPARRKKGAVPGHKATLKHT